MAKGLPGADSSSLVTTVINGQNLVDLAIHTFNGVTPVFWGRYFSRSGHGFAEYQHLKENGLLRQHAIKVLPIAQQTSRVNGSSADGSGDAQSNVEDLITTFGKDYLASQGGEFFMFLDVEPLPGSGLSSSYYLGWSQTLMSHSSTVSGGTVRILPCIYGNHTGTASWSGLSAAVAQGATCKGAWIARYGNRTGAAGCCDVIDWDNTAVAPAVPIPCKILAWQYSEECHGQDGYDCNQTNPNIDAQQELLKFLIMPPA